MSNFRSTVSRMRTMSYGEALAPRLAFGLPALGGSSGQAHFGQKTKVDDVLHSQRHSERS
jgi:hypothetical protein